ncbi:hypothetical protein JX265_013610 [Neoarthrinium moseri]|uniref:Association with the SNF1 complex (ASC) domain-containing protein n=1 Tax=Neoarthrinium moseri TaxID=1658444 RepID=A0A9Q0AHH6_9PEZI|nr:uncharacterized protein JN550_005183 [Neoarthrinium moseri]KAI1840272.1 hypothetical protein JX266_013525 [Neoarthrinium moseri]KAI1849545.1 hypothetical protein JX265_013610 [Neoarthrinium moseri]KAI1870640.1 hypothetical protein JN550_005183 [Neoarthrinium moseri]
MGNSPSTSKPATPTQHRHGHGTVEHAERVDSPRPSKKEPKNLISAHQHQHRSAASSPEASVVSAHGSTIGPRGTHSRPLSILNAPASSSPSARSSVSKPAYPDDRHEPSKPVDVPTNSHHPHSTTNSPAVRSPPNYADDPSLTSGPTSASVTDMSYQMSRPPRLPLPIEEEVHTPGSPIIAPADISSGGPIEDIEASLEREAEHAAGADLTRKSSALSNATDDEDAEELRVDKTRTVPTRVEWLQGGQKVYVTGTPFQWSRKQRLFPAKDREGVLEAILPVFPGTHHIKFLVDGRMETSMHLPTTVDFGNNLVNYIEVSGEEAAARTLTLGATPPKSASEAEALPSRQPSESKLDGEEKLPQKKVIEPAEAFSGAIPAYLSDFDQPEDTRSYQLSVGALDKLPTPPSLPGFLSKPIMNNTTLMKDDNSVLNMPNHTILNHLATSSIKNNVLAVSATTRYKNKYVTTIVYKPTSDDS